MEPWESPVERAIREARERGEFDNLPGAGKPLPDLGSSDDPLWWVRRLAEREGLDLGASLPPAIALRKEAAGFPESLADLRTEDAVRAVLTDFNDRVRRDRLRPPQGPLPPILAPTVDVDDLVGRWRDLRGNRATPAEEEDNGGGAPAPGPHPERRTRMNADVRRAWLCLLLVPVVLAIAFGVGEGIVALLGYPVGGVSPPFWVGALATVPALAVVALPAVLAVRFARRAAAAGDRRGWWPAGLLSALTAAFVVLNTIPLGQ